MRLLSMLIGLLGLPIFVGQSDNSLANLLQGTSAMQEIPTITFCEMVQHPERYFDKTVRLSATFQQATEAQYLAHADCPLDYDEQIGVGYLDANDREREARNIQIRKIGSPEFGGQAIVSVVGSLRNQSRRDFAWYRYRFDILRFETVAHIVVPYQGQLQGAITYQAAVRGDKRRGLLLVPPLRIPEHQAVRIEWTNLKEFPALRRLSDNLREQQIVFSVLADDIKQLTERKWRRTVRCKIIRVF